MMKTESVTAGLHSHTTVAGQATAPLPVSTISNVIITPTAASQHNNAHGYDCEPDGEGERYFDARAQQPWLATESAGWSWHSLAQQIKNALHVQLHTLSTSAMATSLLYAIPADLSKLLAAVLLCSSQGKDILWQSGILGGLELIHQFIHQVAGASTSAALLTSLPPLLLIWLTRQHISLTETVMNSLSLLLTTGLTICAAADFSQPTWLLQLDEQVIAPLSQLLRDTGVTHIATSGIALLLGCYVMLRLCGGLTQKIPQANMFNYGLRLITNISQLCATSRSFQLQYLMTQQARQTKSWYEHTHHKPYQQNAAATALQRAVIRCLPDETLRQKETMGTSAFHQEYLRVEQQILQGKTTTCPDSQKSVLPPGQYRTASHAEPASSSATAQTTPLLIPASVLAGAMAAHAPWMPGRTAVLTLAATAAGATLLAGARYLRDGASLVSATATQESDTGNSDNNICLAMITKIRNLLGSNNSGATLSAELFNYLFDPFGDLRIARANRYLNALDIHGFNATARDEMNEQLRHTLSILWSRENKNKPVDVSQIIINLQKHIFSLWAFLIKNKRNVIIKNVLKELRLYCAKEYLSLGMYSRLSLDKVTNFFLSLSVPDLLLFEVNGLDNEKVISRKNYYAWNYIGQIFMENRQLSYRNIKTAIEVGRKYAMVTARCRSYPHYKATKTREELEETYQELNKELYEYHRLEVKLEGMQSPDQGSITEIYYPDIKRFEKINLKTYPLLIRNQDRIDKNIRILRECENFDDILRNFPDGLSVLYDYAPNQVPEKWRIYDEDKKTFTLKPHLTRAEIYEKYDIAYQQMVDEHCDIYSSILDNAFKILPDEDLEIFQKDNVEIYSVVITVERFKTLRNFLMPMAFRYNPEFMERLSYNVRPYYETGKLFIVRDQLTGEEIFFAASVEISRAETTKFPVWRLPVNNTQDILALDPEFLDTIYLFADGQSLFSPCKEAKEPSVNLMSNWNQTGEFFAQHYSYYEGKICAAVRHPEEIKVSFEEKRLGDHHTPPLAALKALMTENRRKLLLSMEEKTFAPVNNESKSRTQRLLEIAPLFNCYELFRDLMKFEDTAPPSMVMQFLQATLCAADLYTGFGVVALLKSLKQKYARLWLKKHEFNTLRKDVEKALKRRTPPGDRETLLSKMNDARKQMDDINSQITELRNSIYQAQGDLLSLPVHIAYPYLPLYAKKKKFITSNLIPWGLGLAKTGIKKIISTQKNRELKYIWHNPSAGKMIEYEHYYLSYPDASNSSCYTDSEKKDNIVLNIFELRHSSPELYKHLHFTALNTPNAAEVMLAAKEQDIIIPEDHNQMAMYYFITLTIPARFYTNIILQLEDYYKTDKNDIKITQQALYQYYDDVLQKPYITPPVELQPEQHRLIEMSTHSLSSLLQSTIQGIETNYLFMIHYFLVQEDTRAILSSIQNHPENREKTLNKIQRDLAFNMEKFTLYDSISSTIQAQFYATIVERYISYCQQTVAGNERNYALFSPTINTFLQQLAEYHTGTNDARHPAPADYVNHWQQTEKLLQKVYESFARIEFSAQALAAFPPEEWHLETAVAAWRQALDRYLFPEMRYENLNPLLCDTAKELSKAWRIRQQLAHGNAQIISNGEVNPLFITDATTALKKNCPRHPNLFFCMVYQIEDGRCFTPLNNDFIAESQIRSTRQAHAVYPTVPLLEETVQPLNVTIISPLQQTLAQLRITRHTSNTLLYQQYLTHVMQRFLRDAPLPFHQRWQSYLPDATITVAPAQESEAMALINTLIDAQGNIIDYQSCLFRHHLPQAEFPDDYALLQLISDILQITSPGIPPLYRFILHHLQSSLAQPQPRLSTLRRADVAEQQASEIQRALTVRLRDVSSPLQQALPRYILATVRHLLSFARYLPQLDTLLAEAPLDNLAVQWLNLGAIIALQLRLENATAEDLLALSWAAQHDAGLLSLRETGIQQLALLSSSKPSTMAHNEAQDALDVILASLQAATEIQQRIYHSVEASQLLSLLLHDLVYAAMTAEHAEQLRLLTASALVRQRELLDITLQQLSVSDKLRLSTWLQQGKLDAIWYPASSSARQESKIVGFAFSAENQPALLLPVAEPLYMPLIFRQLAPNAGEPQLAQLCFGRPATQKNIYRLLPAVSLNLTSTVLAGASPVSDPADMLYTLMQARVSQLLSNLINADSETRFAQQKLLLSEWLTQHLFFFDRGGQQDYQFIFGQAQRMTDIAAYGAGADGQISADAEGIVNSFRQAIRRVMGASTILPALTRQLTEPTPQYGATPLTSLNINGFAGFWWDAFNRLCYLGWKKGNSRTLYVSTPESRDTLYKLVEDLSTAEIWPMLARSEWLKDDLQATLQNTLSAGRFFAESVPMLWHLHCALAYAPPLPAGAVPHAHLSDVWFTTHAGVHSYFFSPTGADSALPVMLETLPVKSYRLTFIPSDGKIAPDLGFILETSPSHAPGRHSWVFTPAESWQLAALPQAEQLISQGILSPEFYLQWGKAPGNTTSMTPADHILQRNDGCMVFTFDDHHVPHTRYRLLDARGKLQYSSTLPAGWSLMTPAEFQFVTSKLVTAQRNQREALITACALMASLPFRFAASREAENEWHDISLHLRSAGRNFFNEVIQRAHVTAPLLTVDELLWLGFDWRATDFYQSAARDNTLKKLAQQQLLLRTMLTMINEQSDLQHLSEELKRWLHQILHYSMQATTALQLINAQPDNSFIATDATLHLHRQHFAQNYLFNYYQLQLHVTADLFLQPWQCIADNSALSQQEWQPALNQLYLLATSLPHEARVLDRLLSLPDILWQAAEMQQRAQQWQKINQRLLSYWRTLHRKNIVLLRPKATSQELEYIPQRYRWPVRLLLTAGKGNPVHNQTQGIAPAFQLSAEQQEEMLLLTPGPARGEASPPGMAGMNTHPRSARAFVTWAKLLLSSPWALAEFAGPAFLMRLQQRMQTVIAEESDSWAQEERHFYQAADSSAFLLEHDTSMLDKHRYAAFFHQLYNSNLLVTRLIMSDVVMVFALLCERFIEQHPKRATEDVARAWFLFLHTADSAESADDPQSLYLVGI